MLAPRFLSFVEAWFDEHPRPPVVFVTGSRALATPEGRAWFDAEMARAYARAAPGTHLVTEACPASPDVWAWERRTADVRFGVFLHATGEWRLRDPAFEPEARGRGFWSPSGRGRYDGPARNLALAELLVFLRRLGVPVEPHAFEAGTRGTADMVDLLGREGFVVERHLYTVK